MLLKVEEFGDRVVEKIFFSESGKFLVRYFGGVGGSISFVDNGL